MTSLPAYQPSDARKAEYENAEKFFLKVGTGDIRPPLPDEADRQLNEVPTKEAEQGAEIVTAPGLRTGRARWDG